MKRRDFNKLMAGFVAIPSLSFMFPDAKVDANQDNPRLLYHKWSISGEWAEHPNGSGVLVPTIDHHIMWRGVKRPPFMAAKELEGHCNKDILKLSTGDIVPETLLFLGSGKPVRSQSDDGSCLWDVSYFFSERRVPSNDNTIGGWNHFYRVSDSEVGFFREDPVWCTPSELSVLFIDGGNS